MRKEAIETIETIYIFFRWILKVKMMFQQLTKEKNVSMISDGKGCFNDLERD